MVEVTRENFEALLPEITKKIGQAAFLAVDLEYTGIYSADMKSSKSLFDSASQRYAKERENANTFSSCQFGLAIFQRNETWPGTYSVQAYNFYLFPVAFDGFAKRDLLTCQVSCINFLARHKFDFNKFIRDGVPYLNSDKAESLRKFLCANRHFMQSTDFLDPNYFPNRIQVLTDDDINDIISRLKGFSRVMDIIFESKIPVIGHNLYTDLILTFQLFYANLPESYEVFKSSLLGNVFPTIYDTKYLARKVHKLRKEYTGEDTPLTNTNLFALYTNTCSLFHQFNLPLVEGTGETRKYQKVLFDGRTKNMESIPDAECHCAGFDALVTGVVFLNLSCMAFRDRPKQGLRITFHPTFTDLLVRTEVWKNKISVARAIVPYINLGGKDPLTNRPNWIIAKSVDSIDPSRLQQELVKYGDIEVSGINDKEVAIACGGIGSHNQVWTDLKRKGLSLAEKKLTQSGSCRRFERIGLGLKLLLGIGGFVAFAMSLWKHRPLSKYTAFPN